MTTTIWGLVLLATVLVPGHVFRRFQSRFLVLPAPGSPNEHLLELAITGMWNLALTWPLLSAIGIDPLGALLSAQDMPTLVAAIHRHGLVWLFQILIAPAIWAVIAAYVVRKGIIQRALSFAGIIPQPQCAQAFDAAFFAHRDVAVLVSRTYEEQRGKQFASLLRGMESIARLSPFGINVVVNERTVAELDALSELAQKTGASELLLLPQQATTAVASMDRVVGRALQDWVFNYRGKVRLAVSEAGASGLPTCDPLPDERGLQAYAHIDASGMLRASSYSPAGAKIGDAGVLSALKRLRNTFEIKRETQS